MINKVSHPLQVTSEPSYKNGTDGAAARGCAKQKRKRNHEALENGLRPNGPNYDPECLGDPVVIPV